MNPAPEPALPRGGFSASSQSVREPNRWLALVVLSPAQLMDIVDNTIVNIALPSAQHDLGFSNADRQWVITGYALAFGSLLLIGGRFAPAGGGHAPRQCPPPAAAALRCAAGPPAV
jgi:MFS family permease